MVRFAQRQLKSTTTTIPVFTMIGDKLSA